MPLTWALIVYSQILNRFLTTKARTSQLGAVSPLSEGSEVCPKNNRVNKYEKQRDLVGSDTTSRLRLALLQKFASSDLISFNLFQYVFVVGRHFSKGMRPGNHEGQDKSRERQKHWDWSVDSGNCVARILHQYSCLLPPRFYGSPVSREVLQGRLGKSPDAPGIRCWASW